MRTFLSTSPDDTSVGQTSPTTGEVAFLWTSADDTSVGETSPRTGEAACSAKWLVSTSRVVTS